MDFDFPVAATAAWSGPRTPSKVRQKSSIVVDHGKKLPQGQLGRGQREVSNSGHTIRLSFDARGGDPMTEILDRALTS